MKIFIPLQIILQKSPHRPNHPKFLLVSRRFVINLLIKGLSIYITFYITEEPASPDTPQGPSPVPAPALPQPLPLAPEADGVADTSK